MLSAPSLTASNNKWARLAALHEKTAQSTLLSAIGQALSSHYEVPQEWPREMLALLIRLNAQHER